MRCRASSKLGPGVASALTMPLASRLPIFWPPLGWYVPKTLSKVWFSPTTMITCLIGVAGALSCAYAPGGPLSALAARTVALETRPRRRRVVVFMIWHSVGWVPLTLRPAEAPPDGGPCGPCDQ